MCGFAGIFSFSHLGEEDHRIVARMTSTLSHRRPDEEGFVKKKRFSVGHRRLKIIDLTSSLQPMESSDGSVVLAYNGEIYNFQELRDELISLGHKFFTKSDTEVVLHSYLEWGEEFFRRLRGIFAFVIYDEREEKLILARDRFGVKPLYYYISGDEVIFASELKAILDCPRVSRSLDIISIYHFFYMLYIPAPRTGIKGINKLLPSHYLCVKNGTPRLVRYYRLKEQDEGFAPPFSEALERVEKELVRAVKEELVSDVPLGVFLSGGLDSSSVALSLTNSGAKNIKVYTVGFEEAGWDETVYARKVSEILGLEHRVFLSRAKDLESLIQKLIWHFDEPHGNVSAVANYLICDACRKEIIVALSGGGGDELFAGYYHHLGDKLSAIYYRFVPGFLRRAFLGPFFRAMAFDDQNPSLRRKLARSIGFEEKDPIRRHLRFVSFPGWWRELDEGFFIEADVLTESERRENDPIDYLSSYAREYPGKDFYNSLLYLDLHTYLVDDILMMTDRMSSAASLEVRVPFLDHELVEYVFSLPFSYKLPNWDKKFLLKNYLSKALPRELIYRPKQGFGVPFQVWLKNELKDFFRELFESEIARSENIISIPMVKNVFKEHIDGKKDHTLRIWTSASYLLWKMIFKVS